MKNPVISLHGNPRTGKDTLAKMLVERHGFLDIGFADKLYQEVAEAFCVTVNQLQSHKWKTEDQPDLALYRCLDPNFYNLMMSMGYAGQAPRTSRFILQHWGTEYRRAQNPRYWIEPVERLIVSGRNSPLVIHDCRFQDEAELPLIHVLRQTRSDHCIIEITRKDAPPPTKHVSNNRLPDHLIDFTVANDGTPEDMYSAVINRKGHLWIT